MELNHSGMIYFALKEESNQVVHISEMAEKDRGKACECICLCCGRPLVAKLGRGKKTAHFAHLAEEGRTTCSADAANESGLHKIAKEIVCKSEYICLPQVTISEQNDPNRNMEDYKQQEPLQFGKKIELHYQNAKTEVPFEGFKPDVCISFQKQKKLLIEIAVTHYVDAEKYSRIKMAQMPTVEINIADFIKAYKEEETESINDFEKKLKNAIIDNIENKTWVYHSHENEGIQKLHERNRELEKEFQQNRIRILKEQEERKKREEQQESWIQEQQRLREQIDVEVERLHTDEPYYLSCKAKTQGANTVVLNFINRLGICNLRFKTTDEIPFFLNIPVFGEVVFNCDRRIWQTILFEKVFYQWQYDNVSSARIYCYFAGCREGLLNQKFVYIWKKKGKVKFPAEEDLLRCAIEEYLVHLSALGFIDIRYYFYPHSGMNHGIMHSSLKPQRRNYATFLERLLMNFPDTNNPFQYIQEKWISLGKEMEFIQDLDTL